MELNSVITLYRRKKLTQITSGGILTIPKVMYMAFGNGGVDENGIPIVPLETQTSLQSEFCRYPIREVTYPTETIARYVVVIPRGEQVGRLFNEMALVDEAGCLCAVKSMYTKQKDADVIFTFEFDDEF